MKKMLFIVNPAAGQRKILRQLAEVIGLFNQAGFEVTVYMTAQPGDGKRLAREHCDRFELVVCAGGDGTLNEVISGLLEAGADVPVGYLPCGSTNDFAATMKLPTGILQAARVIVEGEPQAQDVGAFGDRYFTYVASFGAFTRTSYTTPQSVKNLLGHLAYWLEGIQELAQLRPVHVRLELEDEVVEDEFLFGAISNSRVVGGVLTLNHRQVDLRDGQFELLLVRMPRDRNELRECILALRDQNYDCGSITFRSVSCLTAYPEPGLSWSLDGERCDWKESIEIRNLHRAVRIIRQKEEL
ncbi:MAG: YegS/Rv2252/BmrU family lipid kinase [Oscillospiraceae bacterium]|nr:YegS/Rv2252/BmrU family lipid kinase [Oscillospiraceae bacterium]